VSLSSDDTEASARRRAVVIAPHPDDETLGCGATIARKRAAGTDVTVVIVADGRYAQPWSTEISPSSLATIRSAEVLRACEQLGVPREEVLQLGLEDTHVAEHESRLVDELYDVLADRRPQEVLVVCDLDHHPDHRVVNRAAREALARLAYNPEVLEFPVWSWIDGPWLDQRQRTAVGRALHLVGQPITTMFRRRPTRVAIGEFRCAKSEALAAHASQTSRYTDEPGWAVMDDLMLSPFLGDVEVFFRPARNGEKGPS
jgi:LmbE family N-acetylglucosaminyl deacetylase